MKHIQLTPITLDRLLQAEVDEEVWIIVPIITMYQKEVEELDNNQAIYIHSPLHQQDEFYVAEEFVSVYPHGNEIVCFENQYEEDVWCEFKAGDCLSKASQMTPAQSRFHGVCVDVEVKKVILISHEDETFNWQDYYALISQHNALYVTSIEPSLDDYVFYITLRRTR